MSSFRGERLAGAGDYPDAGAGAQPEVRKAIERFRDLPQTERRNEVLLWWLIGRNGTAPYKMSAEDSNYTDEADGEETCANCRFFYSHPTSGKNVCSVIRPYVEPEGWCRLWKSAASYEVDEGREESDTGRSKGSVPDDAPIRQGDQIMKQKDIARRVARWKLAELSDKQKRYREFFNGKLEEYGVDSPADLSEEDKKKFFNDIDSGWDAENEED